MQIDFKGYTADCLVSGRLELTADRLTDMLNSAETFLLRDVVLETLHDAERLTAPVFTLRRDELFAAKVAGPRGSKAQRILTVRHRLQAQLGPYNVLGRLHTVPGATVLESIGGRGPMLPLTDATIAYVIGGILEVRDVAAIIINRELANWVRDSETDALVLPAPPPASDPSTPSVRDTVANVLG